MFSHNYISSVIKPYPSKKIPKILDPSYKMDLDLDGSTFLGLFRKGKTHIIAKFHRTYLVICSLSREGKTPSYSRNNTVNSGVWIHLHYFYQAEKGKVFFLVSKGDAACFRNGIYF